MCSLQVLGGGGVGVMGPLPVFCAGFRNRSPMLTLHWPVNHFPLKAPQAQHALSWHLKALSGHFHFHVISPAPILYSGQLCYRPSVQFVLLLSSIFLSLLRHSALCPSISISRRRTSTATLCFAISRSLSSSWQIRSCSYLSAFLTQPSQSEPW